MGKPYSSELEKLPDTLSWAGKVDISLLSNAVSVAEPLPLVAVGSGGSLSAAHLIAAAHRRLAGRVAAVSTPLDTVAEALSPETSVWLLSASGGNVDILNAFATLIRREPKQLVVLCGRSGSRLAAAATEYSLVDLIELEGPAGRDGFLATNSLMAFATLISRAYADRFGRQTVRVDLPMELIIGDLERKGLAAEWKKTARSLWKRDTIVVLHGPNTHVGAIDLESKFTEAALGQIQVADYRNFAHGRHHWLAKRAKTSGVLALTTSDDRALARRTLALIPKTVPVLRVDLDGNFLETALSSLAVSLMVAGWAGGVRGIDPGRPGVPEFGRRLFRLPLGRASRATRSEVLGADDAAAIERKTGRPIAALRNRNELAPWVEALTHFKQTLRDASLFAMVLDYDGTMVSMRGRFQPPATAITAQLLRLLNAGLVLGVATGRGRSVKTDLRKVIPTSLWPRVIVGYYNGAEVADLSDNSSPDSGAAVRPELLALTIAIKTDIELLAISTVTTRPSQITLEAKTVAAAQRLWDIANQLVQIHGTGGVSVVRSSHSVDILASGVSKASVMRTVLPRVPGGHPEHVLTIGDRGRWPGNDFILLRAPLSLSVDEVSPDMQGGWNLAAVGQRGPGVTLDYLRRLRPRIANDGCRFEI